MNPGDELPVGTVTFLFTDIEGSTQLLKQLGGERYGEALDEHRRILREAFAEHGGHEIDTQGDSFFVAFRRAKDAVSCAIACQRRLAEHAWPDATELRVRMGIHTGEPAIGGERYVGLGVNRGARIAAAGHGGQVLLSQTTRELVRDDPVPDTTLRDLGKHQLKDMDEPERIYQVVAPGLREEFPELKAKAPPPFEGREGELAEAAAEEMARSWRRPGRRVLIGATFAAALVGVIVGVLSTQGGGSTAQAAVSPNSVGVIDPDGGDIAAEVRFDGAPGAIAAAPGAIWVTSVSGKTVSRIDPATNQVVQTIPVGGGPAGVATGAGAVWVANGLDGTVSRIDSIANREVQRITVGNGPRGIAYGEGAIWVANSTDGTVSRIDPRTNRAPRTFAAAVGAAAVTVAFDRVWVTSPPTATVVALDPGSGRVLKEIGVGGEPSAVTSGAGSVWVSNRADGTVSKIDPGSATVVGLVRVGRAPEGVAAGPGDVWVANGDDGTLTRVDPEGRQPAETIPLGNPARSVVLGSEGLYVGVQSTGREHRGGRLRVLGYTPNSIDPATAGFEALMVLVTTNDGLVGYRKAGGVEGTQLVPDLAAALPTPTEGGTAYTFEVRRGVRYSNGKLVQPEDFRRAIERVFEADSPDGAAYYANIVGTDSCRSGKRCDLSDGVVVDRTVRTVTFRLKAQDADFLAKLALPFAVAVPADTPPPRAGMRPVPATGPYRIASFSGETGALKLVRNGAFRPWSSDAQPDGYPSSISIEGREPAPAVRAVERGAADIAVGQAPLSKADLDRLAVRYANRLHLSPQLATFFFFLNTRVAPFDDVRVRRAVNEVLEREELARQLGPAFVATCQILPPNLPGYSPACPYASGGASGIDRARRLVRSAGASGAGVTVRVTRQYVEPGRFFTSTLRRIGLEARLEILDDDTYYTTVADSRTRTQTGHLGWVAGLPSASDFLPPLFSCDAFVPADPNATSNVSEFCDESIDARMARATAAQVEDPATATKLWQDVERALLARAPVVPIYNVQNADFVSERVGNYQYHPQWGPLLSQLWVR